MTERWAVIKDWPAYGVSTLGKIKRLIPNDKGRCGHSIKPINAGNGYMRVTLTDGKNKRIFSVHRLVLNAFDRPPKKHECANHKDGKKWNNALHNLEWVSPKLNTMHAVKCGLHPFGKRHWTQKHPEIVKRGEQHYMGKLNDAAVRDIRSRYKNSGISQRKLAAEYHVSQRLILLVLQKKSWAHVT